MPLTEEVTVNTQMLIRKPVAEVFEAFIDPAITINFWFTKSSGKLEVGKTVEWSWEIYDAVGQVHVKEIEPNKRILIEWDDPPCPVEWFFDSFTADTTLVKISTSGFVGGDDAIVTQAIDSKGGFTIVLAGLKAWLEHGIRLNLIADHYPQKP